MKKGRTLDRPAIQSSTGGSLSISATYQVPGPIPPPHILAQYEAISPGLTDRIFNLVENQQEHRQKLERQALGAKIQHERAGIVCGFLLGLIGLGCGTFLLTLDKSIAGFGTMIGSLAILVGVFLLNKQEQRRHLAEKLKAAEAAPGKA